MWAEARNPDSWDGHLAHPFFLRLTIHGTGETPVPRPKVRDARASHLTLILFMKIFMVQFSWNLASISRKAADSAALIFGPVSASRMAIARRWAISGSGP